MKITERLNVEHGVLLRQLDHVEGLLRDHAPAATPGSAVQMVTAALEAHHKIEERLLYHVLREGRGRWPEPWPA